MIKVNITGGLGNQLFQYAFARKLQHDLNLDIELNIYELERYDRNRKLSLSNYILNERVHISNKKLPWFVHRRNYVGKFFRKLSTDYYFKLAQRFGAAYIWYEEKYTKVPLINNSVVYIGGYWQSEKYSFELVDDLKKELVLKKKLYNYNINFIKKIKSTNSVCIHIRRGDYINTDYEVCSLTYYKNAISELIKVEENIELFVFSDDIEWVKQNLKLEANVNYIDNNNPDYIDLYLMIQCKHFIMSNSTFSWWAQYLGNYKNKKVFAPKKWHKRNNTQELYSKEWNLIDI